MAHPNFKCQKKAPPLVQTSRTIPGPRTLLGHTRGLSGHQQRPVRGRGQRRHAGNGGFAEDAVAEGFGISVPKGHHIWTSSRIYLVIWWDFIVI